MVFTRVFLLSLLYGSAVFAAPAMNRKSKSVKMMNTTMETTTMGALYFMTNEPEGNFVVTAALNSDGTIRYDRAVSTRGLGSHGVTSPNGPDGTFSQGAVKASVAGKVLAAVNPGSSTVSLFSINSKNPVDIHQVGQPVSSEGEFPMSVAFNMNGTQACVLNGGQVNGVNCYKVDDKLGLVAIPNTLRSLGLNQTTPPNGPAGTASHVVFSEDGTKLIASVKGVPPNPGFLAVWDVADDGTLSADNTHIAPGKGGLLPFSLTVIPGQNALLATDAGVGFDIFDLSDVKNNTANAKNTVVPIDGQMATCWSSFSKQTDNFYLTDIGTSMVTEVNVDKNLNGTIVKQYAQTAGSATIDNDIATLNGNDFMYVLQPNTTSVASLSLNAPGQAKNIGSFDLSGAAKSAGLTISNNNLQGMTTFVSQN